MDAYLSRLITSEPLDPQHEKALAMAARAGDSAARTALIEGSVRLVALHVRRLAVSPDQVDDAVQAGSVALIQAIDRFDPRRGARLATFAWPWIQGAIGRASAMPAQQSALLTNPDARADREWLDEIVKDLPSECSEVLALRLGMNVADGAGCTQFEVADRLGISVSQVRTREAKAVAHVRRRLAKVGLRASPSGEADPL